ncbi:hypothetical protein ACLKA7_016480 [Drosophila subpalustris]
MFCQGSKITQGSMQHTLHIQHSEADDFKFNFYCNLRRLVLYPAPRTVIWACCTLCARLLARIDFCGIAPFGAAFASCNICPKAQSKLAVNKEQPRRIQLPHWQLVSGYCEWKWMLLLLLHGEIEKCSGQEMWLPPPTPITTATTATQQELQEAAGTGSWEELVFRTTIKTLSYQLHSLMSRQFSSLFSGTCSQAQDVTQRRAAVG